MAKKANRKRVEFLESLRKKQKKIEKNKIKKKKTSFRSVVSGGSSRRSGAWIYCSPVCLEDDRD